MTDMLFWYVATITKKINHPNKYSFLSTWQEKSWQEVWGHKIYLKINLQLYLDDLIFSYTHMRARHVQLNQQELLFEKARHLACFWLANFFFWFFFYLSLFQKTKNKRLAFLRLILLSRVITIVRRNSKNT